MKHIELLTTGGTIEKTYDEASGTLKNQRSVVHRMLRRLRLADTRINVIELMSKDSQDLSDADRDSIIQVVQAAMTTAGDQDSTGIVILHGTDTLEKTGDALHAAITEPTAPIVLTGAMRPFEMVRSDALQNLTEAIFATDLLVPGVYCAAHGRAMAFPGVRKDRAALTFTLAPIEDLDRD